MSASSFPNIFSPLTFGLSLLSAIALSLPQSVQAAPQDGIYLDRTIPTSELPAEVANRVLENASTTSGLPVANLQITSVRQVTWTDGCMGRGGPNIICTMALVDGWIVTVGSGEQKWVYHTNGSGVWQPDNSPSPPVSNPPISRPPLRPCPDRDPKCDSLRPDQPGSSQQNPIIDRKSVV